MIAPAQILERLEQIDQDLAARQNDVERAAEEWMRAKRDREKRRAEAFLSAKADGMTVAEAEAIADRETCRIGLDCEARYEALKRVIAVLEVRASIGQTLARTNARAAG